MGCLRVLSNRLQMMVRSASPAVTSDFPSGSNSTANMTVSRASAGHGPSKTGSSVGTRQGQDLRGRIAHGHAGWDDAHAFLLRPMLLIFSRSAGGDVNLGERWRGCFAANFSQNRTCGSFPSGMVAATKRLSALNVTIGTLSTICAPGSSSFAEYSGHFARSRCRPSPRSPAARSRRSRRRGRASAAPAGRGYLQLAVGDDVEAVARLAFPDDRGPGRHARLLEPAGEALELRRAERREQRQRAEQRDLDHGHRRAAVDLGQRARREEQRPAGAARRCRRSPSARRRARRAPGSAASRARAPAIESPSSTPKTRESTSVGAVRCRSVRPATSSSDPAGARRRRAAEARRRPSARRRAATNAAPQTSDAERERRRAGGAARRARRSRRSRATPPAPNAAFR